MRNWKIADVADLKGVILLNKPTLDKIVAYVILCFFARRILPIMLFWKRTDCPGEVMNSWEDQGWYGIDVGYRKYHKDYGSACECVVDEFDFKLNAPLQRLLELINNNNQDGNLRRGKMALAKLLRDMYELRNDESWHRRIIDEVATWIRIGVEAKTNRVGPSSESRDMSPQLAQLRRQFPEIMKRISGCDLLSMPSPMNFLWNMMATGTDPDEIDARMTFWTQGDSDVSREMQKARQIAAELVDDESTHFHAGDGLRGLMVHLKTENSFITQAVSPKCDVLVVMNQDGHAAVLAKRFDAEQVGTTLMALEPGRWHYDPRLDMAINGGYIYTDTPTTDLELDELVALVQKYPPKRKDREQQEE